MCTCIRISEMSKLSQHSHILSLQYVENFSSRYLSYLNILCRRDKIITRAFIAMAMVLTKVLTFTQLTLLKLLPKPFPMFSRTQPRLRTCHRRTV